MNWAGLLLLLGVVESLSVELVVEIAFDEVVKVAAAVDEMEVVVGNFDEEVVGVAVPPSSSSINISSVSSATASSMSPTMLFPEEVVKDDDVGLGLMPVVNDVAIEEAVAIDTEEVIAVAATADMDILEEAFAVHVEIAVEEAVAVDAADIVAAATDKVEVVVEEAFAINEVEILKVGVAAPPSSSSINVSSVSSASASASALSPTMSSPEASRASCRFPEKIRPIGPNSAGISQRNFAPNFGQRRHFKSGPAASTSLDTGGICPHIDSGQPGWSTSFNFKRPETLKSRQNRRNFRRKLGVKI